MKKIGTKLIIAWRVYQRRNVSLAEALNLEAKFYHYHWEDKSKFHKAFSYVLKSIKTISDLRSLKPELVFFQLPPTPLLYIVALYCFFNKIKYVADCHNAMIYNSAWRNWPFVKVLLKNAMAVLVHNEDVVTYALKYDIKTIALKDPLPKISKIPKNECLDRLQLTSKSYVIVPWSFAPDEPIKELFEAAEKLTNITFVMTWFAEKLPMELQKKIPNNILLTGFLKEQDFHSLFRNAGCSLVLTTREGTQPSAVSESIALNVPVVVSDLKTTRRLYDNALKFVENNPVAITRGIQDVLNNQQTWIGYLDEFKKQYQQRLSLELEAVKIQLGM